VDFVADHVAETFFLDEAKGRQQALRPSELHRAIRNAYQIRSNYVHMLEPIPDFLRLLRLPDSDVFKWGVEPFLTFAGLLRVVHHAVGQFIERGECLKQETYAWRRDLPGTVTLPVAPQYWIWNTEGFQPKQAHARLSGFLFVFQNLVIDNTLSVDLSKLMQEYERLLPSVKKVYKVAMLALYKLFNSIVPHENRSPSFERIMKDERRVFDECGIEMLVSHFLLEESPPWSLEECASALERYRERRFAKRTIAIPVLLELALTAWIANGWLQKGNDSEYKKWAHVAYLEATGIENVQEYIGRRGSEKAVLDPVWIGSRGCKGGEQASTTAEVNAKRESPNGSTTE
jgi:hypothetical protein